MKKLWLAALLIFCVTASAERVTSYGPGVVTTATDSAKQWNGKSMPANSAGALTNDGAGNLSWAATSAGGGLVLLEQHTASNSATLDFTTCITSTYDTYQIEVMGIVPATNSASFVMLMSTNGGSSYDAGQNYAWSAIGFASSGSASSGTQTAYNIDLLGTSLYNGGTVTANGTWKLRFPASAYPNISGTGERPTAADQPTYPAEGTLMSGIYKSTTPVNALQFLMSSGNIASGTVRIYGIAK